MRDIEAVDTNGIWLPVAVRDRPLGKAQQVALPYGLTVAEMVAVAIPDPVMAARAILMIGGEVVPSALWARVRPKPGAHLAIAVRMAGGGGGGGKNPIATVLSIAVMAAAALAAPYLATGLAQMAGVGTTVISGEGVGFIGAAGFMSVATPMITGAIAAVGMLAVSALVPPGAQSLSGLSGVGGAAGESATLSISGGGNRANPYGVYPRVYGRHRITPLYAAEAWTEMVGPDEYLYCLFDCGYGPLEISEIKIGDTPIGEYDGVDLLIHPRWTAGDPLEIYRNDVTTSSLNVALTADGGPQVVVSGAGVDQFRIDIVFQGLTRYTDEGARAQREVTIGAEYRAAGTDDPWLPVSDPDSGPEATTIEPRNIPDGGMSQDYVTSSPTTGTAQVTVTIPSRYRGSAQLHTVTYALEARAEGAAWVVVQEVKATVNGSFDPTDAATYSATHAVAGVRGKRIEIRLTLVAQTVWTTDGDTALIPANAGGVGALPVPAVSYRAADSTFTFIGATAQATRRSITVRPPSRGQWECRLTRLTPDTTDDRVYDKATLIGVVSTTFTPPIAFSEPHTIIELAIKKSDQLNGAISDMSCIAQSILPVWDGADWTEQPTRNPAWIMADVLRGAAGSKPRADSRIDLDGLLAWAQANDAPAPQTSLPDAVIGDVDEPTWTCDMVVDYETTVGALLSDIAAAGRAARGAPEGRFGVVLDAPQTVPVQIFTPRNSWGFRGRLVFSDPIHCLRVRYISPEDGWEQMEVPVYVDGYDATTATAFDSIDAIGCARASQAWRLGRYHLAVMALRRGTFEVQTDIESLVCTRGDLVEVAHDVPMVGGVAALVTGVTLAEGLVTAVTVDEVLALPAGVGVVLRARSASGVLSWHPCVIPAEDAETSTVVLETPTAPDLAPEVGCLVVVGEPTRVTARYIVKEVVPGQDLTARLVLIDEAPAVHAADQGAIPAYDPQITRRVAGTPPAVGLSPRLEVVSAGGRYVYSVHLSWTGPASSYEVYRKVAGSWKSQGLTTKTEWEWAGLSRGDVVAFAVVGIGATGARLPLSKAAQGSVSVASAEALPTDVTGFGGTVLDGRMRLTWDVTPTTVADLWRVRWSPSTGPEAAWGAAVDVSGAVAYPASAVEVPARSGTYLIKGFDAWGGESATAARVVTTAPGILALNVVEEMVEEAGSFSGSGTGVVITPDGVRLDTALAVDDWPDWDAVAAVDYGPSGLAPVGVYDLPSPIDMGAVTTARVSASLSVTGEDVGDAMDLWPDVDARPDWDGVDHTAYAVAVQIATTDGDPAVGPWSDWSPLVVGDLSVRAIKARLVLSTTSPAVTPVVERIAITADMTDKVVGEDDLLCPVGGVDVVFPRPFHVLKAVAVTGDALSSGDRWEITERHKGGFRVAFFDGAGAAVARQFDYIAKGY